MGEVASPSDDGEEEMEAASPSGQSSLDSASVAALSKHLATAAPMKANPLIQKAVPKVGKLNKIPAWKPSPENIDAAFPFVEEAQRALVESLRKMGSTPSALQIKTGPEVKKLRSRICQCDKKLKEFRC